MNVLNLYLDDSGTRHPDHLVTPPPHGHDWFGLGGVMVTDDETGEDVVRDRLAALRAKWNITEPLHSAEIRNKSKNFRWLRKEPSIRLDEFLGDIGKLATSPELTAIACVVDRPGYNERYRIRYGNDRWLLCKTAFTIVVERAIKHARASGAKLRVLIERSDKDTDRMIRGYYDDLRANGCPFDPTASAAYAPLSAENFRDTLYEFRTKEKTSPLMQVADLVLWPICIGGYDPTNFAYNVLKNGGTLIDCKLAQGELAERGIKYSCWDLETARS